MESPILGDKNVEKVIDDAVLLAGERICVL